MTKDEHRSLGIEYFNKTWTYIDNPNRTIEDDLKMIHYAHASRLHWELSGAPILNIVRGEWQISRVYSLLNMGESALKHATSCYEQTRKHNIIDFDLVFAYEAMARAYKILSDSEKMNYYLELGYSAIDQVQDKEDQSYCKNELDSIKNNVNN